MANFDETSPGDTSIVSAFPANERAARAAVKAVLQTDHHEENDANQGRHDRVSFVHQADDPTPVTDICFAYTKEVDGEKELFFMDGNGNVMQFTRGGRPAIGRIEIIAPDSAASHAAKLADDGRLLVFNTAATAVVTLPEQSTTELTAGFFMLVRNDGGGGVLFVVEGSDTIDGVRLVQNPWQEVTVLLEDDSDPNAWSLIGNDWIPDLIADDSLTAPSGGTPGDVFILAGAGTGDFDGYSDYAFVVCVADGEYQEVPGYTATSSGYTYRKLVDGVTELHYINSNGDITQLTSGTLAIEGIAQSLSTTQGAVESLQAASGIGALVYVGKYAADNSPSFNVTLPADGSYFIKATLNLYSVSRTAEGDQTLTLKLGASSVDSVDVSKEGDTSSAHHDYEYASPMLGGTAATTAGAKTITVELSGDSVFNVRQCYLEVYRTA